jgi:hypothetical protein
MDGHLPLVGELVATEGLRGGLRERFGVRVASSATTTAFASIAAAAAATTAAVGLRLWSSVIEAGDVDATSFFARVFGKPVWVGFELVGFEIYLRVEDDKLLVETVPLGAEEVVLSEVKLEGVVVNEVLLLAALISAIADVASLVLVATVRVELVVTVESLSTKPTLGVALEPALVDGPGVVVTELLVLAEFALSEELMFVGEDLLVASTEITQHFVMDAPDMAVEVGPA